MRPEHYQAVVDRYQADRRLPSLVVGILEAGTLSWSGYAGAPTTTDTQFRIGSITKTLTAVLVMQCRDDGLLGLDDPIAEHVPETGYGSATVRSLLAHVSGMQSEPVGPWWERSPGVPVEQLLAANDGSGAVFAPMERYHYSNLGFALLGEAVSRLRGEPWMTLVQSRILDPLGMRRTSYLPQAPHEQGFSVHHLAGTLTPEPAHDTGAMAPAGQLWSTIEDLSTYASFVALGQPGVLSAETLVEMRGAVAPAPDYGLGLRLLPWRGGMLAGHTGSMPGFQATLFIDPLSGDGVVALTNGTTGFNGAELALALLADHTPGPVDAVGADRGGAGVGARAARLLALGQLGLRGALDQRPSRVARPVRLDDRRDLHPGGGSHPRYGGLPPRRDPARRTPRRRLDRPPRVRDVRLHPRAVPRRGLASWGRIHA